MSAWVFVVAWAATLLDQLMGMAGAGEVAGAAIAFFLVLEVGRLRRGIVVVAGVLVAGGLAAAVVSADPLGAVAAGARRGAAYASFFLALGTLREAAARSRTVRRSGLHLVAQPAGRRYLAVTSGAHLFAMILSYGAIDLMGAMVARAGASRETARRLLMGAYRGFATMNCWSPLNIMTVVVGAAVPAADLRSVMPVAFGAAMALLLLGAVVDRWQGDAGGGAVVGSPDGWAIHLRIVALVGLVMASAEGVALRFGVSLATGVTLAVPAIGAAWTWAQLRLRRGAQVQRHPWALMRWRGRRFLRDVPGFRGEAALLATSGFLGVTLGLGLALPPGGLAGFVPAVPAVLVPLSVPVVLIATALLGLNPIAVVAVIGAALPDPAALGVAPETLALACMLGWGVGVGMTPFSASALATARWTGAEAWTVTTRWNRGFTVVGLGVALGVIWVVHWGSKNVLF